MWSIGSIAFLVVFGYEGFDRPPTATLVTLLGDGTSTRDQVLQQGATPFSQATVTGVCTEAADVATLRAYYHSKETVTFTDMNGVATDVRVLELRIVDLTDWWDFTMVLLESDEGAVSQPGTTLAAASAVGATNIKVASIAGLIAGDAVGIGYLGIYETRALTTVGTSGSGGTGLSFTAPLFYAHGSGERVVEVTGA
jgi:hypothetical protein